MQPVDKKQQATALLQKHAAHFSKAGVATISAEELRAVAHTGEATLVDCRDAAERAVSALPGSVSREEFEEQSIKQQKQQARPVVCYCTIGYRTGLYAQELKSRGLPDVRNSAGILLYLHAGGRVHDPATGAEVRRVHTFGRPWDLAPAGVESVQYHWGAMLLSAARAWLGF